MLDHYLLTAAWDRAMLTEAAEPDRRDSFWESIHEDLGSHGPFDAVARGFSVQRWATKHRMWLGAILLAMPGSIVCF